VVWLWDSASGKLKGSFAADEHAVVAVSFSRNGRWLVTGGLKGDVKVWGGQGPAK
jgi:WD40 repeat protein